MKKLILILICIVLQSNILIAKKIQNYTELDVMDKEHILKKLSQKDLRLYSETDDEFKKAHPPFLKIKVPVKNTGLIFFEYTDEYGGVDVFPTLLIPTEQVNKYQKIKLPSFGQEGGSPLISSVFYANIDNDLEEELVILIRWEQRHYDFEGTIYKAYVYDFIKNPDKSFNIELREDISEKLQCEDIEYRDGRENNNCSFNNAEEIKIYLKKLLN